MAKAKTVPKVVEPEVGVPVTQVPEVNADGFNVA
jgi:hypothetical protein